MCALALNIEMKPVRTLSKIRRVYHTEAKVLFAKSAEVMSLLRVVLEISKWSVGVLNRSLCKTLPWQK